MSLGPQHFSQRAIDIIVEDKLAAAYRSGVFSDLPNFGRPDPIFDEPYDPNWWIRKKLERERVPRGYVANCATEGDALSHQGTRGTKKYGA